MKRPERVCSMKKRTLILLTLIPLLVGWLINATIRFPRLFSVSYYILPFLTLIFWFQLGRQYAKTDWNAAVALLIGNAVGLVSLLLYLWQYFLVSDEHRIVFLAVLSQLFVAAVPMYLFPAGTLTMFEPDPHSIGTVTVATAQVLGVLLMVVVFALGYAMERFRRRAEHP